MWLTEILHRTFLKGVTLIVFIEKKRACDVSRGAALSFFSSLCWLVTTQMNQWAWWHIFEYTKERRSLRVCFWEGKSGWSHHSAFSAYLLCHTDGSVSEPQTLLLQQEAHQNYSNYSTQSSLLRSFLSSVTNFHTVWLLVNSPAQCKWLQGEAEISKTCRTPSAFILI